MYHLRWIYHFCCISPVSGRSLILVAYTRIPTTRWCWQPKTEDRGHQDIQWQVGQSGARRCCSFSVFLHRKYKNEFKKNNSRLNPCFLWTTNPSIRIFLKHLPSRLRPVRSSSSWTQNGAFFRLSWDGWWVPRCSTALGSELIFSKIWEGFWINHIN